MRIQYCSDLHLEFPENVKFLSANPLERVGEVLILAGDIVPFCEMHKHKEFFNQLSRDYETVYWVPGNHEYYHDDVSMRSGSFVEKIRENVWLVNNVAIDLGDVTFLFSTLWSHISAENAWLIQRGLTDFRVIACNDKRFVPDHFNMLHQASVRFLESTLKDHADRQKVVVSHHVPTFMNYPRQYSGDPLNEAFADELSDLITATEANAWIFGHHHTNIPEFQIGKTRMLTNQLGYVKYGEHDRFRNNAVLEL